MCRVFFFPLSLFRRIEYKQCRSKSHPNNLPSSLSFTYDVVPLIFGRDVLHQLHHPAGRRICFASKEQDRVPDRAPDRGEPKHVWIQEGRHGNHSDRGRGQVVSQHPFYACGIRKIARQGVYRITGWIHSHRGIPCGHRIRDLDQSRSPLTAGQVKGRESMVAVPQEQRLFVWGDNQRLSRCRGTCGEGFPRRRGSTPRDGQVKGEKSRDTEKASLEIKCLFIEGRVLGVGVECWSGCLRVDEREANEEDKEICKGQRQWEHGSLA